MGSYLIFGLLLGMFEWFVLHQCRRFFAVFVECEHSMIQPFYCLVRLTTGLNLNTTLGSAVRVSGTFKGRQKQTLYKGSVWVFINLVQVK